METYVAKLRIYTSDRMLFRPRKFDLIETHDPHAKCVLEMETGPLIGKKAYRVSHRPNEAATEYASEKSCSLLLSDDTKPIAHREHENFDTIVINDLAVEAVHLACQFSRPSALSQLSFLRLAKYF